MKNLNTGLKALAKWVEITLSCMKTKWINLRNLLHLRVTNELLSGNRKLKFGNLVVTEGHKQITPRLNRKCQMRMVFPIINL